MLAVEQAAYAHPWSRANFSDALDAGYQAQMLLVSARTSGAVDDEDGISLFLVPADAARLTRRGMGRIDGGRVAEVTLQNVQVGAGALLNCPLAVLGAVYAARGEVGRGIDRVSVQVMFQIVAVFTCMAFGAGLLATAISYAGAALLSLFWVLLDISRRYPDLKDLLLRSSSEAKNFPIGVIFPAPGLNFPIGKECIDF